MLREAENTMQQTMSFLTNDLLLSLIVFNTTTESFTHSFCKSTTSFRSKAKNNGDGGKGRGGLGPGGPAWATCGMRGYWVFYPW
jgi:hypothetical protein